MIPSPVWHRRLAAALSGLGKFVSFRSPWRGSALTNPPAIARCARQGTRHQANGSTVGFPLRTMPRRNGLESNDLAAYGARAQSGMQGCAG